MRHFSYSPAPARVVFGSGTRHDLAKEVESLGKHRLLLLSTAEQSAQAQEIASVLGSRVVGHFPEAAMHTPVDVTEKAMSLVNALTVDGILSVGGGSTIGLGKAIAIRTDLDQIVLPTTYAGSEMTPILGETNEGLKTTRSDQRIRPEVVIYDVDLTLDLPVAMSISSGLNAIAHAVEALYAHDGNPIISLMAVEGIRALAHGLPGVVRDQRDEESRSSALYGAWLCGMCLGSVAMGLHHKLCHTLGGTFNLPHAETHAVLLPHALAYNQSRLGDTLDGLKGAFGPDVALGLHTFSKSLGAPTTLRELGMPQSGIDQAAKLALAKPYPNPRPLEEGAIRALIGRAWAGEPPLTEE
nr:maleylacetate reductase [Sphingobium subterraneum]